MGSLADAYKKIIMEKAVIDAEPVPDRVDKSLEFYDYNLRDRKASRKCSKARSLLSAQNLSLEQVKSALNMAIGEENTAKRLNSASSSGSFRNRTMEMLQQKHPELVQELGANGNKFTSESAFFKTTMDQWLKDGKITQADKDEPLVKQVLHGLRDLKAPEEVAFIEIIEQGLSQEQKDAFLNSLNEIVDVNDYGPDELTVGTHDERIEFLRANIPAEVSGDQEKLAKYEHALNYSKEHLNVPKPEVRDEYWSRESTCQKIEGGIDTRAREEIPDYENGKYHNIYDPGKAVKDIITVNEERQNDLDSLLEAPASFSDRTKEGLRLIFAKMDEMNLHDFPYDPSGEDRNKVYGLTKINVQKKNLENALAEGNPDKIIEAQEAYEKTVNDMNELYALAKEYLNPNPVVFPGNMDSIRTDSLPFEFTGDIKTTAMINAAFITYTKMKDSNTAVDDYLNNPAGTIIKDTLDKLKEVSFSEVTKDLSLEDSIDALTESGKFANYTARMGEAVPVYSLGRQLALPGALEGDPNLNDKNRYETIAALNAVSEDMESEKAKFKYLSGSAANAADRNLRQRTLQNLIVASDDERNLSSMLGGLPETNHLGRKVGESFDLDSVIARRPVDYSGIMDRAERLMRIALSTTPGAGRKLDPDEVLNAVQQTYHQVLSLNPQDNDLPAFKRMQEQMKLIPSRLSPDAPADLKGKINAINDEYFSVNTLDSDKNPGWENKAYASGFKMMYLFGTNYAMVETGPALDAYNIKLGQIDPLTEDYIEENDERAIENPRFERPGGDDRIPSLGTENPGIPLGKPIKGAAAEREYNDRKKELITKFRSVIKDTKDERARRCLEDEIFILESDDVKTATYYATSPYGFRLEVQKANSVSFMGNGFGPEDVRNEIGSFYDDQMDLRHHAVEEFRAGVWRLEQEEKLKKSGKTWSDADEKQYADKIRAAHSGYLQTYEKLKRVTDPGLINNSRQQRDGFIEIMDRSSSMRRGIAGAAGWLKGELKALDNGWSTKDMAFLGAFGAIEETMESIRAYGSEADKRNVELCAKDFKALKDKCWNTRVENNADKKEICDAIMAFTEKYNDKTFVCTAQESFNTLLRLSTDLNKEAAKTEVKDNEMRFLREKRPVEYLKKLEEAGDMKAFAMALVDVEVRVTSGKLTEKQVREYIDYSSTLTDADNKGQPVKGWDFIINLNKELVSFNLQQGVFIAQEDEKIARDIREGRHEYSDLFGEFAKDYAFSEDLAHSYVAGSDASQPFLASKQLITGIQMTFSMQKKDGKPWSTKDEGVKLQEEFHKNASDGLTRKQREKYIEKANSEHVRFDTEYGFKFAKNGNLIMVNEDMFRAKSLEHMEKAVSNASEYTETAFVGLNEADNKLQRLKALKEYKSDNSKEFTAMYEALEAITRINGHSTPEQIEEAYLNLDKTSKAYVKAKREDSWFAGRHGNGLERVQMAEEINTFAQEQYGNIWKKHTADINGKVGLSEQVHSKTLLLQQARQAAAPQNAPVNDVPVNNVQVNNGPVNNVPVNNVPVNDEPQNAPDNRHRKMDVKEVRKMLKGEEKKAPGRKTISGRGKVPSIDEPAAGDNKPSRKSVK